MTVTFGGAFREVNTSTGTNPKLPVLASDVPAGASIIVGIQNRTDETTTLTSISDPVNGTWSGATVRQGPTDNASASTGRTWFVVLTNSAALSGAGNRTLTVTFSTGISAQIAVMWANSDLGALTFDALGTLFNPNANTTDYTSATNSNTVTATGAGCAIGFVGFASAQTIPNPAGGGETLQTTTSDAGSYRANLYTETYGSAGTYGFEITAPTTTTGPFHIVALLEPSAASSFKKMLLLGVG